MSCASCDIMMMVVMFMWLRSFWADFRSALFIRCNVPININHMHTCIYAFGCDISDMHIMMFVYCRRPGYWIIFDAASLSAPVRNCSPTFKFPFIISPSNLSLLPLPWSLLLYLNVYSGNSLFPSLPIHPSPLLPPSLLLSLPPSLLSPLLLPTEHAHLLKWPQLCLLAPVLSTCKTLLICACSRMWCTHGKYTWSTRNVSLMNFNSRLASLYVHPCLPDIMAYGELSQVVLSLLRWSKKLELGNSKLQLWGNRWLYVYGKQYWPLFHDVTMMSISWEWNRICYLHAKFWPLPLWCHSYIMHNLDAACLWLKWSSQLVHSFTVTVCASYRGRGLGSTLCKSLVMHNLLLLVTEQLSLCLYMYENRGSFLLQKFPTVYGISCKSGGCPHPYGW